MNGELDMERRPEIRDSLRIAAAGAPILVDLSEVTYADSSVLSELLRFHGEAQQHGVRVALVIVSKQFARLVQYAGLAQAFSIFDSTEAAQAYLASGGAQ